MTDPRCPRCDYSLIGLPHLICPECGHHPSFYEVYVYSHYRWPRRQQLLRLAPLPWLWFAVYFLPGSIFPKTLDHVSSLWLTLLFLNLPLHLLLACAAFALLLSSKKQRNYRGAWLLCTLFILIAGHVLITAWVFLIERKPM